MAASLEGKNGIWGPRQQPHAPKRLAQVQRHIGNPGHIGNPERLLQFVLYEPTGNAANCCQSFVGVVLIRTLAASDASKC